MRPWRAQDAPAPGSTPICGSTNTSVGTAESYKLLPSGPMMSLIKLGSSADAQHWTMTSRLSRRSCGRGALLEFDVAYDPKGGL